MLCWNLPSGPKHLGSLQKNMAFSEGNDLFAGDFCANMDETNADMELKMDCLKSRMLLQKIWSYKC